MKVLVTGSNGQLGKELCETLSSIEGYEVIGYDRKTLDISDYSRVKSIVSGFKPDAIINTAAYTNVDGCETDYFTAQSTNIVGARNVARAAEVVGAKVIHISTDFVFDGLKKMPYFEYDSTNPLSVYGKTKLAGEWAVRNECRRHFIIRTSWLYGKYGNNFVKTMIELGRKNDQIKVVADQVGSPTCVTDLISALTSIIVSEAYGTYHYSNQGNCSWNEFACFIFLQMEMDVTVEPIKTKELGRLADRPSYAVMDTRLIQETFGLKLTDWRESLSLFLIDAQQELRGKK